MRLIREDGTYVLIATRPWNVQMFALIEKLPGTWHLSAEAGADEPGVDAYFYLDCSDVVDKKLVEAGNRYGFHTGPYRGGSPVQHAIIDGYDQVPLYLFRLDEGIDTGPVVCATPVSLHGGGEEIFARIGFTAYLLLKALSEQDVEVGEEGIQGEYRARRQPADSHLPPNFNLKQTYDFIRALEVPGYPPAFIRYGSLKIILRRASWHSGGLLADATILVEGE